MRYKGECAKKCCTQIVIQRLSYGDLRLAYLAWLSGVSEFTCSIGTMPVIQDIFLLYPMLKPIGTNEDGDVVYFCKNFDKESGLCSIYEIRPTMCRNYPGRKCPAEGCTLEPA